MIVNTVSCAKSRQPNNAKYQQWIGFRYY